MQTIADNSIDMIWTDPPYGHSNHDGDLNSVLNTHRKLVSSPIANDDQMSMRTVVDGMLVEAARILRSDCCCCCCCCGGGGGGPQPTFAWIANRMDKKGMQFFHAVIWNKNNPGLGWRYRRQYEMVMVAHRVNGTLLWHDGKRAVPNIYNCSPPKDRDHPNEKPVRLIAHFLSLHASKGHIICDPFMGSGSTGVAAIGLGMKFIGIELDRKYFDIACRRVEGAYKNRRMSFQL